MTADRPVGALGATRLGESTWSFVVWAPRHDEVSLRLDQGDGEVVHQLQAGDDGYFSVVVDGLTDPPTYRFALASGDYADPASRWQPDGVHGPSRGFDPAEFTWSDNGFSAGPLNQAVIYELHIGTFTAAGSFDAAIEELDRLVELGITAVEPMPINAFPGERNWGYDGVFLYAVQDSYGGPLAFQRFVDACHQRGLAVILDVVYNHIGPEGNVLAAFGPYFTAMYATPWGEAVNVAEAGSDEVRRFFSDNAVMWLRDFHVDGLRVDAVHGIIDPTASPFLRELTARIATLSEEVGRRLVVIAESADNNPLVTSLPGLGGLGFDAQWNDDFHHCLHAVLTGEHDGYYADYGPLADLACAWDDGFSYQGEHSVFRGRRHGVPARALSRDHFVVYSQDHDQVGNRAGAERLLSLVGEPAARLAAAAVLLSPFVPMLFMGEEYAEIAPFPYFVDHGDPELLAAVRAGRGAEFGRDADQFDPGSVETFARARLDPERRDTEVGKAFVALYRGLIAARRRHAVITDPTPLTSTAAAVGSVLSVVRRAPSGTSYTALNVGAGTAEVTVPGLDNGWRRVLDSADPHLGGGGQCGPDEIVGGAPLRVPGYGFALYVGAADSAGEG